MKEVGRERSIGDVGTVGFVANVASFAVPKLLPNLAEKMDFCSTIGAFLGYYC